MFQHLPWLKRVWPMPRRRGGRQFARNWPVIRALRREHFDRSVDFASNDRGAILSLLIPARRQRLGLVTKRGGFLGRQFCYNRARRTGNRVPDMSRRGWRNCFPPGKFHRRHRSRLKSAPTRRWQTKRQNPAAGNESSATSPPASRKKNGRSHHWAEFRRLATGAGLRRRFHHGTVGANAQR